MAKRLFYHYKMVSSSLWNTFIPNTMKSERDYLKEIEVQSKKPLDEQLNDLKVAGAKFLVALDKIAANLDTLLKEEKS